MYKSIYYDRNSNQVHLWTDGKHGDKPYECFKYEKYAYTIDSRGEHLTLNNLKVKKVKAWSKQAEEDGMVFEHDVLPTTRVLIDRYSKYDDVSQDHVVLFFDIEVEKGLKYSKPHEALNVINAISYYDTASKGYTCLLLDRSGEVQDKTLGDGTSLKRFSTEEELLLYFVNEWRQIGPSIVTGWNSSRFDVPYLYKRLLNLFGEETASLLSPIGIVKETRPTVPTTQPKGKKKKKPKEYSIEIAGIASMDYQLLYQKFTYNEEASFKLEAIAQKELGRGKVQYEGTLDDFYKNDLDGFIQYNVTDVELLVAMDKKLNLIEISRGICHKGYVPYDEFQYSSKYLDGAIQNFANRNKRITYSKKKTDEGKAKGAFVKPPKVGLQKWLASIDLQSLYPNIIITCNISPETQIAQINNWENINLVSKILEGGELDINKYANFGFLDDNSVIRVDTITQNAFEEIQTFHFTKQEFVNYIQSNKYSISARGIIFKTDIQGIVPAILEKWFNERLEFKKLAKEHKNDPIQFVYYDNLQLITKILLNSLYGVLLLPSFRYYDKKNGESVTLTGQSIIKFTDYISTLYYRTLTKNSGLESPIVYGDSDSVAAESLIRLENGADKRIDDLFHAESQKTHYIDPTGREFTFPTDLNFPYYDEENKTIKFGKVKCIERHFVNKDRFEITTSGGESIIVSEDHSVMVYNDSWELMAVKALDLTASHIMVTFDKDLVRWLDPVVSVVKLERISTQMYDVGMVDTPHTFFANNILVHNSAYLDMKPLIPEWEKMPENELVVKMDEISDQILVFINKTIKWLAKHHLQSDNCRLLFLKEKVIKRGFWGQAKKRYALLTIDPKTMEQDIVIKGFDSVRSDFPKYFRKILEELIVDILHDATVTQLNAKVRSFKKSYLKRPYKEILVPNSVKELSKYKDGQKGSPINVKSAQNYNKLMRVYNLDSYPKIEDGDKILYGYLTENPFGFETLAITGYDDPPEILEFMETYLDKHKIFESKLVGKIESIWEDLGFGKLELKTSNDIF